ncbi:MAG: hypothetical protein MUO62_09695, partial [Anaerolineales bacterium]|nr:hypothetical protein [Anaerolineales bacterium]
PVDTEVISKQEGKTSTIHKTLHTPKGDLTQTLQATEGVHTTWQVEHLCKSIADVDKALSISYEPLDYDASDYPRIKQEVGEHGIIMASLADPMYLAADLMEFGEFTIWAMMESDHFARTVEIIHERVMENLKRQLEHCVLDLYRIAGPEYATPPFLPPRFFKIFVVPYVSEMVDLIHSKGSKVRIHCHGKIARVLDLILETGADGIDPCEAPPDGDIVLADVKQRVGRKMCIFGNLQLKLLETGTPEEVERAVINCMEAAKAGGGYVIMPTAAPIDIPLSSKTEENYFRFIESALKYGLY